MDRINTMLLSFEAWGIILCIIAGVCVYITRRYDPRGSGILIDLLMIVVLMCLSEMATFFFFGNDTDNERLFFKILRFCTFGIGFALISRTELFVCYVLTKYGAKLKKFPNILIYGGCSLGFLLMVILHYFGIEGFEEPRIYDNGNFAIMYHSIVLFCLTVILIRIIYNRKGLRKSILIGLTEIILVPYLSAILRLFNFGGYFVNIATIISFVTLVALVEIDYGSMLVEKEKKMHSEEQALLQKEIEVGHEHERLLSDQLKLEKEQISLYNHQIQPHFIFNTLTAIRSKCEDGSEARKGIDSFAAYLRGCVDMLTKTECVPIEREMTIVDSYIDIMQIRFGNKIKVIREIEEIGFLVPPFAIQSIVENAIDHGIRNKPDRSGNVWIRIFRKGRQDIVEIKDDGVGFDTAFLSDNNVKEAEQDHIGIINTKRRVEAMCGGSVEIDSVIGEGTTVRLYFPVERGAAGIAT
ncbi:MAG: histidine kinase [Lachnospiraceae bacterium]|nr:histidine kinase [Lachnospiraceae bacterium]